MTPEVGLAPTALTTNSFTRTGYTFVGGTTAANGSGTSYADDATYSIAAKVTFYAQWKILTTASVFKSSSSARFGSENTVMFWVAVLPSKGIFGPSGDTAVVHVGTASCVTTTLILGLGGCTIGANALPVGGRYAVSADSSLSGSNSIYTLHFTVLKASQTISFASLANTRLGKSPLTMSANSSSALAVTFTTTTPGVCTSGGVDGTTVTLLKPGTCTVVASQIGNGTYSSATPVSRSFTVSREPCSPTRHRKADECPEFDRGNVPAVASHTAMPPSG